MIKLPEPRVTDFRAVEDQISGLRSRVALRDFYQDTIERYLRLNASYQFTESFEPGYVFDQIDQSLAIRDRELFGIPVGVKDVFNTTVLPTSMGSEIWRGFKAGNNARVVDEIADRGAIIFSKTTTAEFAVHYIQNGKTLNPHNAQHITGTSSAGSAVAVACGALPICLGTQTAGSIVRPASFCGVFGFKPSFGAFDRTGTLKTTDTLDTIGLLGSDIYGLRKTFLAAFQRDRNYPIAVNYFDRLKRFHEKTCVKIGVVGEQFSGYADYDANVKEDFRLAVDVLARSPAVEVAPVGRIEFINEIHPLHEAIYCKSLSYYFQDEFSRGTSMSEIMTEMISVGSRISVAEYIDALKKQPEYRARFDPIIAEYDFLVTPSTGSVAPPVGATERRDTCLIWTFFGYPVLSIPAFWSGEHGLPFGLQIVAPKFCDLALLDFAERVIGCLQRS
jgi:Asp-tRNA(Asn)/Glu-tRNA(Gln) amidotransferase A subunit family amidase